MSYGVVMCSKCQREVHQSNTGWFHCDDKSDICVGADRPYARSPSDLKGEWCGVDSCGLQPQFAKAKRDQQRIHR